MEPTSVAVFGSSETIEGERLYDDARRLGRALGAAGYRVVTGGYGGVMEAASRGAAEVGGATLGVISTVFRARTPNRFLAQVLSTPSLHERTRALIELSQGYVVLWGKSGTLAEATLVWALTRAESLDARPVIVLGDAWARLVGLLTAEGMLEERDLRTTRCVRSPDEVIAALRDVWRERE